MKLVIDIPEEFEEHFNNDRFEDSLHRLEADVKPKIGTGTLSGLYEAELVEMLRNAFRDACVAGAMENGFVLHNLKEHPDDLPKRCREYLTNIGVLEFDTSFSNRWLTLPCEACDFYEDVTDEVTAWCELPKLEVE